MSKKLNELFDIETFEEDIKEQEEPEIEQDLISEETLATIEKVENALPQVKGLEASDKEIDEIADLAQQAFKDLMDLGMQTDPRFSAEIFSVSGTMLGHALSAKTAKVNKKLKMLDLQLKKAELERKIEAAKAKNAPPAEEETPLGVGQVIDRNELIKMIMNSANDKNKIQDK